MSDKWLSGNYTEINSVEEFYDDLLNYIDINELIILSAQCLLKVIPLKDMLDAICDPVLEQWDTHKEKIIQELESMDNGVAKNLAAELQELYFSTIEETAVGFVKKEVTAESISAWAGDGWDFISASTQRQWSKKENLIELIENNNKSIERKINLLVGSEKAIVNQILANHKRHMQLIEEKEKLDARLKVFGPSPANYPPNFKTQVEYYEKKITGPKGTQTRAGQLRALYLNMCDQLKIHFLLCASYDLGNLKNRSVDASRKQAINLFLDGDENLNIPAFVPPVVATKESIIPNLILINPYMKSSPQRINLIKKIGIGDADGLGTVILNNLGALSNKLNLTNSSLIAYQPGIGKGSKNNFKFTFSDGQTPKNMFDQNLKNIKTLMDTLSYLNSEQEDVPGSPFNKDKGLQKLTNFGADTVDAALNEIFKDEGNKYYLCLAIIAAIPSAAYLAYKLIRDYEVIGDYFANQGKAIWKGVKKRWQLLLNTDYYTMDILKALGDQLVQVGVNLARDLILNGIMAILRKMRKICLDEDKINAPYNPIGAIDLSEFMIASKNNPNSDETNNSVEDTPSYSRLVIIDPGITGEEYRLILDSLSEEFTIKEMAQLLDNEGPDSLYNRSLKVLEGNNFLREPIETPFYKFYVKPGIPGVKQFFAIIAKDIEPAYIQQAIANFEKEKTLLLEICFGRDDSVLENILCPDLPPEECLKTLAAQAELPKQVAKDLVKNLSNLFDTNIMPDPCTDGKGLYDDSQKFGAKKIGNSIFGGIEMVFEGDIRKVKDIYLDTYTMMKESLFFHGDLMRQIAKGVNSEDKKVRENAEKILQDKNPTSTIVAPQILRNFKNSVEKTNFNPDNVDAEDDTFIISDFNYFEDSSPYPNAVKEIKLTFQADQKSINLLFDSSADIVQYTNWNTELRSSALLPPVIEKSVQEGKPLPEPVIGNVAIQRYVTLSGSNGWNIKFDEKNSKYMVRPPDHLLFGYDSQTEDSGHSGITFQSYSNLDAGFPLEHNFITAANMGNFALENQFYEKLFVSVLKDLLASSMRKGLYNQEKFKNLNLNKEISMKNAACFFGFMNKNILNENMQQLADRLACYNPNNPAINPVNVSTIKFTFDCVVRIIVVKEVMKSLFVYGVFPQELDPNSISMFNEILIAELQYYIPLHVSKNDPTRTYDTFYNEVVKTFITDMMRIIYQDNTLTHEEAFRRTIKTQFDYVKKLFNDLIFPLIAVVDENDQVKMPPLDEYQIISDAFNSEEGNIDPYEAYKLLGMKDQIQSLQNEYLTFYMNSFHQGTPLQGIAPITNVKWEFDGKIPQFQRKARILSYMDYATLSTTASGDLHEILQGNNEGIALEKLIELSYQADFFDNNKKGLELFEDFLLDLGRLPLIQGEQMDVLINTQYGSLPLRLLLKNMFYETKLIMFFPQLKNIIDSLNSPGGTWTKFITPVTWVSDNGKQTVNGLGDLFLAFFRYNYDEFGTIGIGGVYEYIPKLLKDKNKRKDINWALTGKMYMNDFRNFIDSFAYPIWPEGTQSIDWLTKQINQEAIASENIFLDTYSYGPSVTKEMLPGGEQRFTGAGEGNIAVYAAYNISAFSDNIGLMSLGRNSLRAIAFYAKYKNKNLKGITKLLTTPWIEGTPHNFFIHLFGTDMSEIIQINPLFRLNAYVNTPAINSLGNIINDEYKISQSQTLLKEKVGEVTITGFNEKFGDADVSIPDREYISTPLLTSQLSFPKGYYTWYTMLIRINKFLGTDSGEYFKKIAEVLEEPGFNFFKTLTINDSANKSAPDIFNLYEAFDAMTPMSEDEKNMKWLLQFKSTQWFNIRGISVPKEEIIRHVGLGENVARQPDQFLLGWDYKDKSQSGINFAAGTAYNETQPKDGFGVDVSPYVYLTDVSLASLREDSEYFLNEDKTAIKDEFMFLGGSAFKPTVALSEDGEDPVFNSLAEQVFTTEDGEIIDKFIIKQHWQEKLLPYGIEPWRNSINSQKGWKKEAYYVFKEFSTSKGLPGPTVNNILFLDEEESWEIKNPSTGEVLATCPKFIAIKAYEFYKEPMDKPIKEGESKYYFIDYGWWRFEINNKNSVSLKYNEKFPGSTFANGSPPDSKYHGWEPLWLKKDLAGGMHAPDSVFNFYMDDDHAGNFIHLGEGKNRGPWRFTNVIKDNMPDSASATSWAPGYMEGGITSVTKSPQKIELETPLTTTAYDIFLKMTTELDRELLISLLRAFFLREQTTIVALINKLLAEKHYPQIEETFKTSLTVALNALSTAVASAHGDWQYTAGDSDNGDATLDFGLIGGQLLKMFLGAFANTVDPLWKTPWFQPGPFTPIGMAAKALDEKGFGNYGSPGKAATPAPPGIPYICEDPYNEQLKLLNELIDPSGERWKNKKP